MNNTRMAQVAATPSSNAATFVQIVKDAEAASRPFVDDMTPEGHFGVTVKNVGGVQTYWFQGDVNSPDEAPVVGREQIVQRDGGSAQVLIYEGGSIMGGTFAGAR